MMRRPDVRDEQIQTMLRRRSAEPYPGFVRDVMAATAGVRQERRRGPALPTTTAGKLLVAAALLAALLIGGTLAAGGLRGPSDAVPSPLRPGWMGPVRPDAATMPAIAMAGGDTEDSVSFDEADAEPGGIDIVGLRMSTSVNRRWTLDLRAFPVTAAALAAAGQVIEYGVVIDDDADGVADCLAGISTDAPRAGDFRVWVVDLASGTRQERVGPPYGFPIDFRHPDERPAISPSMAFFFLPGLNPCQLSRRPAAFYAWATMSVAGAVTDWDYAPDGAWLLAGGAR